MYVSKAEGEAKDLMGGWDLADLDVDVHGEDGFLVGGSAVVVCGDRVDDSLAERRIID